MPQRPHIAYPVTLTPGGRLRANEQDTEAEVADCIAVILSWPIGTRRGEPGFGVPTELFESGGPRLDEIHDAVVSNEPRAVDVSEEVLDATLARGIASVTVGFDEREVE